VLSNALRVKYGPELGTTDASGAIYQNVISAWRSGRTNINLSLFTTKDTPVTISIVYQTNLAQTADKL